MSKGYLSLVLHTHLPFVRHPEYPEFLEEDWLFQAITETYVPQIEMFNRLAQDDVPCRLTVSLSPPLLSMLSDELLQSRYMRFLGRAQKLAELECKRTQDQPEFNRLAGMYREKLCQVESIFFHKYEKNLVNAYRDFQDKGLLDLITCGATHGYLPIMNLQPKAVRAQIQVAVQTHEKFLGRKPKGIWLPECGYAPGIEKFLDEAGIRFFFLDGHGILNANPKPRDGVYAPVYCPNGVAVFGRDKETSKQVWSADEGYPGDISYRDFYRDIGFDLDYDYIRPFIATTGERKMTGFKYYRITGKTDHKEPYDFNLATEIAAEHAGNFMFNREKQIEHLSQDMDKKPIVIAPYDAELFGHWWWEGPQFLEFLIRKTAYDQSTFQLLTPYDYLNKYPDNQVTQPSASSWGHNGYHEYWLGEKNDWIYLHLNKAAERMIELAQNHPHSEGLEKRALNQAARELLLAQSSDWAFIMTTGTMVDYAVKRTKNHISRFNRLFEDINSHQIDPDWLVRVENMDNIFPDIDFRVYS
jgi:1,4-alpha-glucan branching enzyme